VIQLENKTYEEAVSRLEEIVQLLEKNEVPLEESINLFQEGIELSQYCNKKLENIQNKVAKIYEDGELKDFTSEE
jgi:exodeoxyribonuclease VII small subunit